MTDMKNRTQTISFMQAFESVKDAERFISSVLGNEQMKFIILAVPSAPWSLMSGGEPPPFVYVVADEATMMRNFA